MKGSPAGFHSLLRGVALWCLALAFIPLTTAAQPVPVHAEAVVIAADFSYTVYGLTVSFEDRSAGIIIAWGWSFGDDSGQVSHDKSPSHEYMTAGKFVINLRVTDDSGLQDQVSRTVSLGNTDSRTLTLGSGTLILVVGLVLLFKGEDNVKLTGLVVLVVGLGFLVSLLTDRDIIGRIIDLFPGV
jgi:hypothetical protein